jgi:hypothetical protein
MSKSFSLTDFLALVYDRVYSNPKRVLLEQWVVTFGAAGFLVHLALVLLARSLPNPPSLIAAVGHNFLSAIYTPFTFILFYEVVILIAAIPQSMVESVANQFEIVSLIFVRGFFKDIAAIDDIQKLRNPSQEMLPVLTEVGAGLLMFLLVTVFQHVSFKRRRTEVAPGHSAGLRTFVARKKAIALALAAWLLTLTVYSLAEFADDLWNVMYQGHTVEHNLQTTFYADVFSVMIFTDVLILILSLAVSDRYEMVFRNGAFVISTILIRFSLTTVRPWGATLALVGMVFGIMTMLIYRYSSGVRARYGDSVRNASPDEPLLCEK